MTPEQITAHPVHGILAQLSSVKDWPEFDELAADTPAFWMFERICNFADLARERLDKTRSTLIGLNALNALQSSGQQAMNELAAFRSNKNAGHLDNAVAHLDTGGLSALSIIPPTTQQFADDAADSYFERVTSWMTTLGKEKAQLATGNQKLADQIAKQAVQIAGLSETVTQQKAEAQQTNAEVKRDYAKAEAELRKQFQDSQEKQAGEHATALTELRAEFETLRSSTANSATDLVEQISAKRDKAAEIVQIVGNIGLTGNYQKIANVQGEAADTWRVVTVAILLCAAGFGAYTLWEFGARAVTWESALIRMVFTFVIASIALYTGRESARHRTISDNARRVELELASLGPFLESMEAGKRNEIREKLVEKYFGNAQAPHIVDPTFAPKHIEALIKAAKEPPKG